MLRFSTLVCITLTMTLGVLSGCNRTTDTTTPQKSSSTTDPTLEKKTHHVHSDGDELVWELKEKIDGTEFEIWYGHHGTHFHGGDEIEPSVAITQGGKAYADAKVFNAVVDPAEKGKLVGVEVATVYEPESEKEIAHYAQGGLVIPKEGTEFVIRFRVALPDHADEITRDVKVKISH